MEEGANLHTVEGVGKHVGEVEHGVLRGLHLARDNTWPWRYCLVPRTDASSHIIRVGEVSQNHPEGEEEKYTPEL